MKSVPPFKLEARPLSVEARNVAGFRWADEIVGTRHRLGGEPDFLQGTEHPICPHCQNKMTFYAQLDSIGDAVCIADCGMVYVFICFDCNESASFIQT